MKTTDETRESPADEPATSLLGGLLRDARDLFSAHGERLKLEVKDELGELKRTIKITGIAVATVVVAALLAAQAIALALADAFDVPAWAGYAIFAVAAGIAGVVLVKRRPPTRQLDLVPEQALEDAKLDAKLIAHAAKH
jgi:hypothetical protein